MQLNASCMYLVVQPSARSMVAMYYVVSQTNRILSIDAPGSMTCGLRKKKINPFI